MNRPYRLVTILFLLFTGLYPELASAEKAEEEGISLQGAHEVITTSIVYHPHHVISMWVKVVPEEDSNTLRQIHRRLKERRKDYRAYVYSNILVELDCQKGVHRKLTIMHYNKQKNIIYAANSPDSQWQATDSKNGFHMLHMAFCSDGRGLAYSRD